MSERAPWQIHFGFTRTPFGKTLAPSELFTREPHEEAVARIRHCIVEAALGVITGDSRSRSAAARARLAGRRLPMDVAGDPPGFGPAHLARAMPDLDGEEVFGAIAELDRAPREGRVQLVLVCPRS